MFDEPSLAESLIPAIEEQLKSSATPYVAKAHQRLVGHEHIESDEAKLMIALCLADESNRMYLEKRDFDVERYQTLLKQLPELPEEPAS